MPEVEHYYIVGYCANPKCKTKNVIMIIDNFRKVYDELDGLYNSGKYDDYVIRDRLMIKRNPDNTISFFEHGNWGYVKCHACNKSHKFCVDDDEVTRLVAKLV